MIPTRRPARRGHKIGRRPETTNVETRAEFGAGFDGSVRSGSRGRRSSDRPARTSVGATQLPEGEEKSRLLWAPGAGGAGAGVAGADGETSGAGGASSPPRAGAAAGAIPPGAAAAI